MELRASSGSNGVIGAARSNPIRERSTFSSCVCVLVLLLSFPLTEAPLPLPAFSERACVTVCVYGTHGRLREKKE